MKAMFRKLWARYQRKRLRSVDLATVWPSMYYDALDRGRPVAVARALFLAYAKEAPQWNTDYTESELRKIIQHLI